MVKIKLFAGLWRDFFVSSTEILGFTLTLYIMSFRVCLFGVNPAILSDIDRALKFDK